MRNLNKRLLFGFLFLLGLILINVGVYFGLFIPFHRPNPQGMADVPTVLVSYFTDFAKLRNLWTDLLFGKGLQGSAIYVRFILVIMIAIPVIYLLQETILYLKKGWRFKYQVFYTSWKFIGFLTLWAFLTGTINGIAQAENWYWNPAYKVPGSFDFGTHIMIGTLIFGWVYCFAFSQFFRIDYECGGDLAELFDTLCAGLIVLFISLYFEYIEFINPDRYWNLIGNSYSDIFAAVIVGGLMASFFYKRLVDYDTQMIKNHYVWRMQYKKLEGVKKRKGRWNKFVKICRRVHARGIRS